MKLRRLVAVLLLCSILAVAVFHILFRIDGLTATAESEPATQHRLSAKHKIAIVGDLSCPPGITPIASRCQASAVAKAIEAQNVDAVLLAGDLQYNLGEESNFYNSFAVSWASLLIKSYAVPGNHEYGTHNASGYFNFWNSQPQGVTRVGEANKGYYSLAIGAWKVLALNSNCDAVGGCGPGSAQAEWIKEELSDNSSACTIAFWHHPVFSSGKYKGNESSSSRGRYFWQLLDHYGADVIVNGHDHLYERFAPQTYEGVSSPFRGIRQFIAGTGGYSLYSFTDAKAPNHEFGLDTAFGYLQLELSESSYAWKFIGIDNVVYDEGRDACHH